jgi:hypothetical protein
MTSITVALLIIIAAAASVLIGLAALISLASRREDAEWTLGEPSPGLVQAMARRVLGFHSGGALASSSGRTARTSAWGGSATSADPDAVDDDRGR